MSKTHWSLDKRFPVALVMTILLQSGVGIWWAANFTATTNQRLTQLEKHQQVNDDSKLGERMVRLEVLFQQVFESTQRIERQLSRRN